MKTNRKAMTNSDVNFLLCLVGSFLIGIFLILWGQMSLRTNWKDSRLSRPSTDHLVVFHTDEKEYCSIQVSLGATVLTEESIKKLEELLQERGQLCPGYEGYLKDKTFSSSIGFGGGLVYNIWPKKVDSD